MVYLLQSMYNRKTSLSENFSTAFFLWRKDTHELAFRNVVPNSSVEFCVSWWYNVFSLGSTETTHYNALYRKQECDKSYFALKH